MEKVEWKSENALLWLVEMVSTRLHIWLNILLPWKIKCVFSAFFPVLHTFSQKTCSEKGHAFLKWLAYLMYVTDSRNFFFLWKIENQIFWKDSSFLRGFRNHGIIYIWKWWYYFHLREEVHINVTTIFRNAIWC